MTAVGDGVWTVLACSTPRSSRGGGVSALAWAFVVSPVTGTSDLPALQVALGLKVNSLAIAVGSAGLFLLVLLRVAGLLERVRSQAVQLAALSRLAT